MTCIDSDVTRTPGNENGCDASNTVDPWRIVPAFAAPERRARLLTAVGCLLLAGCGGGGGGGTSSPGPALSVGAATLSITGVLGGDAPRSSFTVANSGGGTLSYRVAGNADWLELSPTSGSVAAGSSATVAVTANCSQPGTQSASVSVTGAGRSATVTIDLSCDAPPIGIAVSTPPASDGEPRQPARATLQWSISSTWSGQDPVAYAIAADHADVTIEPNAGTVALDEDVAVELQAQCPDQAALDIAVTVEAGDGTATTNWQVRCRAGNAAHRHLEYYQGPQAWTLDWASGAQTNPVSSIAGRRVAMIATVTHESATVPELRVRIHDAEDLVLADGLDRLFAPVTARPSETGGEFVTLYGFDLPGNLYHAAHRASYEIDPDQQLDETNEDDNVERVRFGGLTPPTFRITFIPIQSSVGTPEPIDPEAYMTSLLDLLPIADDYRAGTGDVLVYEGEQWNQRDAALQLLHLWNAQADADEFYHGIFDYPFDGSSCGFAWYGSPVAVSGQLDDGCTPNIYAHEVGHNFQLDHAPGGCGANDPDPDYPYEGAGVGPRRGWLFSEAKFIDPDAGYYDVMSYCEPNFISDYHYEKAVDYWRRPRADQTVAAAVRAASAGRQASDQATSRRTPPRERASRPSMALTGSVDAFGRWSPAQVSASSKPPRTARPGGSFTLTLVDEGGTELHREPLATHPASNGDGAAWSARVPVPQAATLRLVIRDQTGRVVLRQAITEPAGS